MRYVCYALLLLFNVSCIQTIKAGIYGIKRGVVQAPPGTYDLNALEVICEPASIEMGDEVTFSAFFDNRGHDTVPKASFRSELLVNGDRVFFIFRTRPCQANNEIRIQVNPGWLLAQ